jgi:hypothetical protein
MILVAMAVSVSIAMLVERIAYRPLRNAPRLVPLIAPSAPRSSCSTLPRDSSAPGSYPTRR